MREQRSPVGPSREEERILILAPFGRDAALAARVLGRAGLQPYVCRHLDELREQAQRGAGVALLTEEALVQRTDLARLFVPEPPWSELPLVVLTAGGPRSGFRAAALRRLDRLRSTTFLPRPVPRFTLVSTLRASLASRRRQYAVRDLLEKLAAGVDQRDRFLAILGHELRNPLSALVNGIELLGAAGIGEEDRQWAVSMVRDQVSILTRLLDDLLDVSRIVRGKIALQKQALDLRSIAAQALETCSPLLEERAHDVLYEPPGDELIVRGDPVRLKQIVLNLLTNAARYTPAGGHVKLGLDRRGHQARLHVTDDGRGLTAEELEKVFDPFWQSRLEGQPSEGLGIGLTLAQQLAEKHGGSLSVSSGGVDQGSTFTLELPLADDRPLVTLSRRASETEEALAGLRVLVVDDNAANAKSSAILLRRWGCIVEVAHSGIEALAKARELPADVGLLDIGLPDISGVEVARRLRFEGTAPDLLIAITGFAEREGLASVFDRYLLKPLDPEQLLVLLRPLAGPRLR